MWRRHVWEWRTTVSAVVVNGLLVVGLVLLVVVVVLRGCKDRIRIGRGMGAVRMVPY